MSNTKEFDAIAEFVGNILDCCGIPPDSLGYKMLTEVVAHKVIYKSRALLEAYKYVANKHRIDVRAIPKLIDTIIQSYKSELCANLDIPKKYMFPKAFITSFAIYIKMNYYNDAEYQSNNNHATDK